MLHLVAIALLSSIGSAHPTAQLSALDSPSLVEALNAADQLTIDFGPAGLVTTRVEVMRPTTSGGFVWSGSLAGDRPGSLSFAVQPTTGSTPTVQGVLRLGHDIYRLKPGPDGTAQIAKVAQDRLPGCGNDARHAIGHAPSAPPLPPPLGRSLPGQRPIIDVMVVYTAAARSGEGSVLAMEAMIELAAAETNLAIASSGMDHRVRVVHTYETAYVESGNHVADLTFLRMTGEGNMDEVHALRDLYGADCVMLITDTLSTCGNGYMWVDPPNPTFGDWAFSVVSRHCAVSNLSFAHEIAHNLGSDHDQGNGTSGAYPYSRGFRTASTNWRTVMAYPPGTRIPRFSDPNSTYVGETLGITSGLPGQADNVQSLLQVAPLAVYFRDAVPHPVGAGMPTSAGQVFTLGYSGWNRLWLNNFKLDLTGGLPNGTAIAFYGYEENAAPFLGGLLHATAPLHRLPVTTLDSTGSATISILPGMPFAAGQEVFFQVFGFDPANPNGQGALLSNGLRVEFLP